MTSKNMDARRQAFEAEYSIPDDIEFNGNWYMGGANVTELTIINLQWHAWNAALDSICVELPFAHVVDEMQGGAWTAYDSEKVKQALGAAGVPYK